MNENEDIIELDEADFQDTPVEEEVESTPAELGLQTDEETFR